MPDPDASITTFDCGPATARCKCDCRRQTPDESRPPCEHDFSEWVDFVDDDGRVRGGSRVCSRCGLDAMTHDLWVLP